MTLGRDSGSIGNRIAIHQKSLCLCLHWSMWLTLWDASWFSGVHAVSIALIAVKAADICLKLSVLSPPAARSYRWCNTSKHVAVLPLFLYPLQNKIMYMYFSILTDMYGRYLQGTCRTLTLVRMPAGHLQNPGIGQDTCRAPAEPWHWSGPR